MLPGMRATGKSLKNTLRKFNKDDLFAELMSMIEYFTEVATEKIPYNNRVKSPLRLILSFLDI